jgi:hypothetical protein
MPMGRESLSNSAPIWRQPGPEVHDDNDNVGPRRLFQIATGTVVEGPNSPMVIEKIGRLFGRRSTNAAPSEEDSGYPTAFDTNATTADGPPSTPGWTYIVGVPTTAHGG